LCRVDEDRARAARSIHLRLERPLDRGAGARVRLLLRRARRLVRDELRLQDDLGLAIDDLDHVLDRGERAVQERDQPGRSHADGAVRRRFPLHLAAQHALAQVERALVLAHGAVAGVERLVVDEQPDDLAVRHVDDRLAGLRVAVCRLGVGKGDRFVDAVEVRPGDDVRLALVEVAAPADVPVGEREDRLGLAEAREVQVVLADAPRLARKALVLDQAVRPRSSSRSSTTTSAPWRYSASFWFARSTPTTRPKFPARPASTPARASSKTAHLAASRCSMRAASRNVSGAGFPCRCSDSATLPSTWASKPVRPAALRTSVVFLLDETTAVL